VAEVLRVLVPRRGFVSGEGNVASYGRSHRIIRKVWMLTIQKSCTKMIPKISVIIPCYNSQYFIAEAINSALSQSYSNLEVIVVDDGSTDNSLAVINEYQDRRLIVLRQPNQGACVARNLGLKNASGDYVKFLDADDVLANNIISEQASQLELAEPGAIVFGYCYNFVGDISNTEVFPKVVRGVTDSFAVTLVLKTILTSCAVYPVECLREVGGFDDAVTSRQEWALNLKLLLNGYRFQYFDSMVYYRRLHDSEFRISNRRHESDSEMRNLDAIFSLLPEYKNLDYLAAWSSVYWRVGRYILINEGRPEAEPFFDKAKHLSPSSYRKYWPKSYKLAVSIFGLYLPEKIQRTLMQVYRRMQYRKY
jgi:glycosyltransferase involved in cell wall biosynthesis